MGRRLGHRLLPRGLDATSRGPSRQSRTGARRRALTYRAKLALIVATPSTVVQDQYAPLMTKKEPRIVPASFDFWRGNLNRSASSWGTSMPSESLNPTARFPESAIVYITLIDSPDS